MAKYTTTIKTLQETTPPFNLGMTSSDYPIFNESYRAALNKKILDHYRFREIGFETPALFAWFLNVKLREIMPYYNQLYSSALLSYDPLSTYKMSETSKKQTAGTTNAVASSTSEMTNSNASTNKNVHSDTPSGLLGIGNIDGDVYASALDMDKSASSNAGNSLSTATNNNTMSAVDDFIKTVEGRNGGTSPAKLIQEFRKTFLNIDMLIVHDLEDLFMLIW